MRVGHERRELVLDAEELIYRIVVPLVFFALDFAGHVPLENVSGELLRSVLLGQRVSAKIGKILFRAIEITLLMRGRRVAQLRVMAGDPETFDQSEGGKQFGLFEQDLRENLFVEQVQAPR